MRVSLDVKVMEEIINTLGQLPWVKVKQIMVNIERDMKPIEEPKKEEPIE